METFRSVKSAKLSELIAQQIKAAILNGEMRPGDRLPPERELVERFRASRISVREGLKSLESVGLLNIKPGSGVFVAEVSSKPMSESLYSMLRIQKGAMSELPEARIIIEPSIAKFACERIEPADFLKLSQNIEDASKIIASNLPSSEKNMGFHSLLAEATHNTVVILLMENLANVWKQWISEQGIFVKKRIEISSQAIAHHKKILSALKEKNSSKVYDLMLQHTLQIQRNRMF